MVRRRSPVQSRSTAPRIEPIDRKIIFYSYVLHSSSHNRYYIGCCEDIDIRLKRHNTGQAKSTKSFRPLTVVCGELFMSGSEARKRELQIKANKAAKRSKS